MFSKHQSRFYADCGQICSGILKSPLQFLEEEPINHFSVVQLLIYKYYYVLWSVKNAKKQTKKTLSLSDPGEDRGCSTNTPVTHSFIHSLNNLSLSLPQLYGAATPTWLEIGLRVIKIDYVMVIKNFQHPITGSKGMAILLKG